MPAKIKDNELLAYYHLGWGDSSNSYKTKAIHKAFDEPIFQKAYNIGWSDFICGDDVTSVDNQSDKQVLKRIKESKI